LTRLCQFGGKIEAKDAEFGRSFAHFGEGLFQAALGALIPHPERTDLPKAGHGLGDFRFLAGSLGGARKTQEM